MHVHAVVVVYPESDLVKYVKYFNYVARVVNCPAVFALRVKVANLLVLLSQVVTFLLVHTFTPQVGQ